jgi:CBS-domain-containing membrane protein
MKVKDAMHKGVDWVNPNTPITELAKLMCEHDIGAIPIGENDHLIGMVTDRDIVCKGLAQEGFDASRATARDVMTPGIHCCREDDDLAKAVRHMEGLKVRRLPVINKGKRMVGTVWVTSAIRHRVICCRNASRAFRPITTEACAVHLARRNTCPPGTVQGDDDFNAVRILVSDVVDHRRRGDDQTWIAPQAQRYGTLCWGSSARLALTPFSAIRVQQNSRCFGRFRTIFGTSLGFTNPLPSVWRMDMRRPRAMLPWSISTPRWGLGMQWAASSPRTGIERR